MKKLNALLVCVALVLTADVLLAQTTSSTSSVQMTVTEFYEFENATQTALIIPATEFDVAAAATDLVSNSGTNATHTLTLQTNSDDGVDVTVTMNAAAAGSAPTNVSDVFDDISWQVTASFNALGASQHASYASPDEGSSAGATTFVADGDNADVITGVVGGEYDWDVVFRATLLTRFALEGERDFDITYEIAP